MNEFVEDGKSISPSYLYHPASDKSIPLYPIDKYAVFDFDLKISSKFKDCALIYKKKLTKGTYLFTEPFNHILNVNDEKNYVYFFPNKDIHFQIFFFVDLLTRHPEKVNKNIKVYPAYLKCKRLNCKSNNIYYNFFEKILFCDDCIKTITKFDNNCCKTKNCRKKRKDCTKPDQLRHRCVHVKCTSP